MWFISWGCYVCFLGDLDITLMRDFANDEEDEEDLRDKTNSFEV